MIDFELDLTAYIDWCNHVFEATPDGHCHCVAGCRVVLIGKLAAKPPAVIDWNRSVLIAERWPASRGR